MSDILQASKEEKRAYLHKEEVDELEKAKEEKPRWFFPTVMIVSLIVITIGAELLGRGSRGIIQGFGISDTLFGMIFVAAVSFEEIAREVICGRCRI
ncbi:MAG: hypothetical protein AB1466_05985 [Actinomycetota bacterium]